MLADEWWKWTNEWKFPDKSNFKWKSKIVHVYNTRWKIAANWLFDLIFCRIWGENDRLRSKSQMEYFLQYFCAFRLTGMGKKAKNRSVNGENRKLRMKHYWLEACLQFMRRNSKLDGWKSTNREHKNSNLIRKVIVSKSVKISKLKLGCKGIQSVFGKFFMKAKLRQ